MQLRIEPTKITICDPAVVWFVIIAKDLVVSLGKTPRVVSWLVFRGRRLSVCRVTR